MELPLFLQGSERFLRSDPPFKSSPSRSGMPALPDSPAPFPCKLGSNQTDPAPPGGARPVSRKGCPHWFLPGYLSCALRYLKGVAFEEPHHLHLQRLLGGRLKSALDRPRPARLCARHGSAPRLLRAQTRRVATATARPRPHRFWEEGGGGARGGAGRAATGRPLRLLLVSLAGAGGEVGEGPQAAAVWDELQSRGTGSPAPRVPQPCSPPVRARWGRPSPPVSSQISPQTSFPAWRAASWDQRTGCPGNARVGPGLRASALGLSCAGLGTTAFRGARGRGRPPLRAARGGANASPRPSRPPQVTGTEEQSRARSAPAMKPNFSLRLRVFNLNCW